uniref:Uncharacterized protein n=1 Tax=Anopheles quadriannulatus TaxID=34691 RepID=A0A182XP25_ANOQN
MTIREDAAELVRVDLAKANGSAYFGQTGMIDAGGRVGDGQDGQIQFDRLEFESPEDLMRHLYYTCMRSNTSEPPWTTDGSVYTRRPDATARPAAEGVGLRALKLNVWERKDWSDLHHRKLIAFDSGVF